eukprot:gene7314-8092_t
MEAIMEEEGGGRQEFLQPPDHLDIFWTAAGIFLRSAYNVRSGSHSPSRLAKCRFCDKTCRGESQRCLKHVNECTQIPAHKKEEYVVAVQSSKKQKTGLTSAEESVVAVHSSKKQKTGLTSAGEIAEVLKDDDDDDDDKLILKGVIARNIPFRSLYDNVSFEKYSDDVACTWNTATQPGKESTTYTRSTATGRKGSSMSIGIAEH